MGKPVLLIPILAVFLLSACATTPTEDLRLAREAIAQARAAGAEELAPGEYQSAQEALSNAENLILYKNYRLAHKVLPMAAALGYRATFKAREERVRIDAAKKEEAQLRLEEKRSQQVQPPPDKTPAREEPPRTEVGKEKKALAPPPLPTRYEVKKEESLWLIAAFKEVYNDPLLWPLIYKANRDQIKDPRQVFPGQILAIPRSTSPDDQEEARREARESDFFSEERSTLSP
jgi:nucleoid-associated protein YgaU